MAESPVSVNVRASSVKTYTVEVVLSITVEQMKNLLEVESGVAPENQRLIYAGQVMTNDRTLESYGIKAGHTMHLVAKQPQSQQQQQQPQQAPQSQNTQPNNQQSSQPNPQQQPNFANLFGGMGGMGGMGGQPGFAPGGMGGMGGMQGFPSFQQIAAMMQNPAIQNMVQELMQNPQMLQQMMASNPLAQQMLQNNPQMAQMLQNPEIFRMLGDPDTIRNVMQMFPGMMGGMPQQPVNSGSGSESGSGSGTGTGTGGMGGMGGMGNANPFMGMNFAQFMAPQQQQQQQQPQQSPEQRFSVQLRQLSEMGFTNQAVCIQALLATNGNVEAAVERLVLG